MINKAEILDFIRRFAADNNGKAPGTMRLATEIGLRKTDWYPHLWARWGDAVREAGLQPNTLQGAYGNDVLLSKYVTLIRELERFPIESDLILKHRRDAAFPDRNTFTRLGSKRERVQRVLEHCRSNPDLADIVQLCEAAAMNHHPRDHLSEPAAESSAKIGFVYLVRHGSRAEYKIGKTLNPIRREGEIRLELPEKVRAVHSIKTDDPSGVEAYWHERFGGKRKEGEWFALSADDARAFRRWKRIF